MRWEAGQRAAPTSQGQWQPTLTAHDPNPPLTLETDTVVTGTLDVVAPSATCSFTGDAGVVGTIAATAPSATCSFTGAYGDVATLDPIAPAATCTFTGSHGVTSTLAAIAPAASSTFTAVHGEAGTLAAIAPAATCSFTCDTDESSVPTPTPPEPVTGYSGLPEASRRRRRGVSAIAPTPIDTPPPVATPLAVVGTFMATTPRISCEFRGVAAVVAQLDATPFLKGGVRCHFKATAMVSAAINVMAPSVVANFAAGFELVSDKELVILLARIHEAMRTRERLETSRNATDHAAIRRPLPRRKSAPELV